MRRILVGALIAIGTPAFAGFLECNEEDLNKEFESKFAAIARAFDADREALMLGKAAAIVVSADKFWKLRSNFELVVASLGVFMTENAMTAYHRAAIQYFGTISFIHTMRPELTCKYLAKELPKAKL